MIAPRKTNLEQKFIKVIGLILCCICFICKVGFAQNNKTLTDAIPTGILEPFIGEPFPKSQFTPPQVFYLKDTFHQTK